MEIQTRRHILEIWRATVDYSYRDEKWTMGRPERAKFDHGRRAAADHPVSRHHHRVAGHRQRRPDGGRRPRLPELAWQCDGHPAPADQVHRRLHGHLPGRRDAGLLRGHLLRSGGQPRRTDKPEQRKLHVVDSYSMSVTLCLATLGFLRVYRQGLQSQRMPKTIQEVDELEKLCLTAADRGHGRPAAQLHREHLRSRRPARPDHVRG